MNSPHSEKVWSSPGEKGEPPCGSQGGSPDALGNNHIQKRHSATMKTTHSRAPRQYSLGQSVQFLGGPFGSFRHTLLSFFCFFCFVFIFFSFLFFFLVLLHFFHFFSHFLFIVSFLLSFFLFYEFYAPFLKSGTCWNSSKDNTRSIAQMIQMNRNVMVSSRNRKYVSRSMMIKAKNIMKERIWITVKLTIRNRSANVDV